MMSDTSFRNNKGWVTHGILLIPAHSNPLAPEVYLLDLVKWKYNEWMEYNNEELEILAKNNKPALRL